MERRRDDDREDRKGPDCHCQGARLLVLIGPIRKQKTGTGGLKKDAAGSFLVEDATMYTAQHWALEFYAAQRAAKAHIHMLGYDAPSGAPNSPTHPQIPQNAGAPAEQVNINNAAKQFGATTWSWNENAHYPKLEQTIPACCCFFTEVMIVSHGNQGGLYTFLTGDFRKVLAGRPVEKLVLWNCKSSDLFTPDASNGHYQKVAWMVRPKMCGCGCTCASCNAFDPDCVKRHCPDGTKPTTILTSGEANGTPAPLGIDPSKANPLSSPDGRLREITIQPDGGTGDQVTAAMGAAGQQLFNGLSTGTDATLLQGGLGAPNAQAVQKYAQKHLKGSKAKPIHGKDQEYVGPKTDSSKCDAAEGCLTGAGCSQPM